MKTLARTENTALVVALLVFAFLAACFQIYSHDTGFHLKTGEWIDAHGELPATDPFSFTRASKPWPLQQGYSAWIFWRVYSAWGVEGLISFKALIVMLTYGLVLWTAWRESGVPALATCATALGVLAGRYRFYERPILLSAFLLAALWACLSEHRRTRSTTQLAIAVGILTLWANLHAGFIDGMVTLGALAFAGTLIAARTGTGKLLPRVMEAFRQNRDLWLTWVAALVLAVGTLSVLNPMGSKVLLIPFTMLRSDWFQSHVTEFLPLPLGNYYATWVLLVLTGGVLALAWVRKSLRATDAFVFALFAWGTLTVNRQMLPLSIVAPSILAAHAASLLRGRLPSEARWPGRAVRGVLLVGTLAAISWFGFVQGERFRFGFGVDYRSTPLGAFRFIEENDLPGEVWNEDAWGGAFLWRFWPERRNFVDNRLGVFDEPFFLDVYIPVRDAHPQWQAILDHYGINTLLMELNEKPIGIQEAAFRSHRWVLVYWDDQSLVYVRRSAAAAEFVRRFEYRLVNPNNLASSLTNRAEIAGIISELERAVSNTERSWQALNSLGVAYGIVGRYAEASRMFRRALEADPGSRAAQANLRLAERRLGGEDGGGA